ncbi:hypothetical protein BDV96DRAFT_670514 [Lophiotrema nucula]|uniref:Uncharacterized protein n=1 Tax=Lophiotrema nucula TaxID=690887 RepID=A0A6A5YNT6_9PLEO|nr:hypothetical protein BDV96DRAFT_670514 [Lophiotrema nucula]
MANQSLLVTGFLVFLFLRAFVAAMDDDLRPATIEPQSDAPLDKSPAPRNLLARQSVQWCNNVQYCMNSICCLSTDYAFLSCMPSDGDCCANGRYCLPGYACSRDANGYLTCECKGSTCSGNIDPGDTGAKSSSSEFISPTTSSDTPTSSDAPTSEYTPTAVSTEHSTSTHVASTSVTDDVTPTNTLQVDAQPQTTEESKPKGLSQSDKIALGCGIGIGLPAALAGIITCIHQISH